MSARYFTRDSISPGSADPNHGEIRLIDEQAHHLMHVMRKKVGEEITVFDGSGWQASAEIIAMSKREVTLKVLSLAEADLELANEVTIAVSLPKGDRQKFLVEKLVEVGTHSLIPIVTERSVAQPSSKALQRLEKNVIEASKQCERNKLMKIESATSFTELAANPDFDSHQKLIATTHGETVPADRIVPQKRVLIAVGPEGGFSLEENQLAARQGFQPISMGPRILRVETAAVVAVAILGKESETCQSI